MGLPHEDPQQHILNLLEISDTYITNKVTPDYVRLILFPFSLLGKAKRWLKAEPTNSITSWNDRARKYLARFFPSGKTAKIRNFHIDQPSQSDDLGYYQATSSASATCRLGKPVWEHLQSQLEEPPKFLLGGNQGAQNQYRPQVPQQQYRPPQAEQYTNSTSHLEEMMKEVMADQQAQTTEMMKRVMADQQAQVAAMRNLERQLGQLASAQNTRLVGALPRDTEANPKSSINDVSLRNGRQLEEVQSKRRKYVIFNEKPDTIESQSEKLKELEKPAEEAVAKEPPPLAARPPPPFPQRLRKVKDNAAYKKFLDILKQVQINIPLDILANKRRLIEFETVALTEECSLRIQSKLPQKLKDPGSFTIQISIGKHAVRRVLCDLGLMPLSVFRQLGFGEPPPTTVILQLVDRSLAHPEGVIEDVLVQVGSFIFPVDFIILDYELDQEVPFILGHLF
ncbi:uncharacterized protein [Nicotiana tomentosiformis]|uniref:uncharacterized protein n=1 Tax=Nicotiana tomentosiformis TaxID=4098 RepID=UPI00388CC0E8